MHSFIINLDFSLSESDERLAVRRSMIQAVHIILTPQPSHKSRQENTAEYRLCIKLLSRGCLITENRKEPRIGSRRDKIFYISCWLLFSWHDYYIVAKPKDGGFKVSAGFTGYGECNNQNILIVLIDRSTKYHSQQSWLEYFWKMSVSYLKIFDVDASCVIWPNQVGLWMPKPGAFLCADFMRHSCLIKR